MDKFDGTTRGFEHFARTWLYKHLREDADLVDSVRIGFYRPDETTAGEFLLYWKRNAPSPVLEACCDCWDVLARCSDVLERLEALKRETPVLSPWAVCDALRGMGLADVTRTERHRR